ncbi:hypothetical protein F8388_005356 [Cannabis sativa]|uniref:Uncharacterized protein n=1 Tax=Cannabis sativa TaxID=3483 RepID=A0A7J6ELC2_CANSA|nr:hypothetical protein F8388_005356 [Cannabis sativa]
MIFIQYGIIELINIPKSIIITRKHNILYKEQFNEIDRISYQHLEDVFAIANHHSPVSSINSTIFALVSFKQALIGSMSIVSSSKKGFLARREQDHHMADAVVSFVIERLGDLVISEAEFLHGI